MSLTRPDVVDWCLIAAAILLLVVGMCGCGSAGLPQVCVRPEVAPLPAGIVGGVPSTDRRATVDLGFCTGTVVGPHTILTAAHCGGATRVGIEGHGVFQVSGELEHPDFSFPNADLRLLFTEEVLPEPYAELAAEPVLECHYLLAQGYGLGSGGELHERQVDQTFRDYGLIETSAATCNGDSGGPLWAVRYDGSYVQVGVTSYGRACDADSGNGFVDLTQQDQAAWVEENIK